MTYVYMARSGRFVKIGLSTSPAGRVATIGVGSKTRHPKIAKRPILVHAVPGDRNDERRLHEALKSYRVIGEWFSKECMAVPELVAFLGKPAKFEPKQKMLSLCVTQAFRKHVKVAAAQRGITVQRFIIDAVEQFIGPFPEEAAAANGDFQTGIQ